MVYWLHARFAVRSLDDLSSLSALYGEETAGELTFTSKRKKATKIAWCANPFASLYKKLHALKLARDKEGVIECRLGGVDTVRAVSQHPVRLDQETFVDPQKELLLKWARHIDEMVASEMGRENDMGWIHESPEEKLGSMEELHQAIRLSQHVTHSVPCRGGFLVANTQSVYLSYVALGNTATRNEYTALVFDKDDGFLSMLSGTPCVYLNTKVQRWRDDGCRQPLAAYLDYYEGNGFAPLPQPAVNAAAKNPTTTDKKKRSREDDSKNNEPEKKRIKFVLGRAYNTSDLPYLVASSSSSSSSSVDDDASSIDNDNDVHHEIAWLDPEDDQEENDEENSEGEEKDYQ
jgi:hypothetical protein